MEGNGIQRQLTSCLILRDLLAMACNENLFHDVDDLHPPERYSGQPVSEGNLNGISMQFSLVWRV
jgi:hypothetical protein